MEQLSALGRALAGEKVPHLARSDPMGATPHKLLFKS